MSFSTYSALKSEIADWLNRDDLTSAIPEFIRNAESELRRDPRVRRQVAKTFSVDAKEETLPSTFRELDSLYLAGDNDKFGQIEIVDAGNLSDDEDDAGGVAGVPQRAAIIDQQTIRFAPTPDQTYDFKMVYKETIPFLSGTQVSNWLLERHQDIYLFASLIQAAPYIRDDQRVQVWRNYVERGLEGLHRNNWHGQYSGSMVRRVKNPIP